MAILGSLFKRHKQEKSEQETNIRSSENVISEKVIDTPFGKGVIREERYPANPMISDEGMPLAYQMATDICWKHNTHQDVPVVWASLNSLYTYVQKNSGMTLRLRCMGRNPYSDPMLEDFREEAHSFSLAAARYLLDFFYNVKTRSLKCAADFLYFAPSERHLDEFFEEYSQYNFTDRAEGQHDGSSGSEDGNKVVGKAWAGYLFDQCEETLMKY